MLFLEHREVRVGLLPGGRIDGLSICLQVDQHGRRCGVHKARRKQGWVAECANAAGFEAAFAERDFEPADERLNVVRVLRIIGQAEELAVQANGFVSVAVNRAPDVINGQRLGRQRACREQCAIKKGCTNRAAFQSCEQCCYGLTLSTVAMTMAVTQAALNKAASPPSAPVT